jgi:glutamate formiminotransferase/formiminotetrahydrofolate cyclodeaminase
MSLSAFANETASESPAPGGGSISAYVGALGISLGTMVANLSSHKPGWDERWDTFSEWAVKGQKIKDQLLRLVDEDTRAFNAIMTAFGLAKGTDEEKQMRKKAIQDATRLAIDVPVAVMELAYQSMEIIQAMAASGNPNSVSDAGVGALCATAAVRGAHLNVMINIGGFEDTAYADSVLSRCRQIEKDAIEKERVILAKVTDIINSAG